MCITEELRKYAQNYEMLMSDKLLEIADRIDFEHRQALNDAFYDAIDLNDITDDGIAKYGLMRLPKDADGEYIHIGDVMEFVYDPPQDQPMFEVSGFGANGTLFYAARGGVVPRKTTLASVVRHHHAPTVEDMLTDMLELAVGYSDAHTTVALDAITTYAKRLRLAGDE